MDLKSYSDLCGSHECMADHLSAIIDGLIQLNGAETLHDPEVTLTPRGKAYLDGNTSHR